MIIQFGHNIDQDPTNKIWDQFEKNLPTHKTEKGTGRLTWNYNLKKKWKLSGPNN